jgi:hypothetical protein
MRRLRVEFPFKKTAGIEKARDRGGGMSNCILYMDEFAPKYVWFLCAYVYFPLIPGLFWRLLGIQKSARTE